MPRQRCQEPSHTIREGKTTCSRFALPGTDRCAMHSPEAAALRERRAQLEEKSRLHRDALWELGNLKQVLFPLALEVAVAHAPEEHPFRLAYAEYLKALELEESLR